MQKVQKTYTAEFKQEAVQLAQTSGKSIGQQKAGYILRLCLICFLGWW